MLGILSKLQDKIRYYGILSTRTRKTKLIKCQQLTGVEPATMVRLTKKEIQILILGKDPLCCPHCGFEGINRTFAVPKSYYEVLIE